MKKIIRITLIHLTLLSILCFGTATTIVPKPLLRNIVTSSNYQGEAFISFQYKDADIIYLYQYNERNEPELIYTLDTSELNIWVDSAFYICNLDEGLHTFKIKALNSDEEASVYDTIRIYVNSSN